MKPDPKPAPSDSHRSESLGALTDSETIDIEFVNLRARFKDEIGELPPLLAMASENIVRSIRLNNTDAESWTERFERFTIMYPLMQAEIFEAVSMDQCRHALLGHLLMIAHTVIQDRLLDRQIRLNPLNLIFSQETYARGMGHLNRIPVSNRRKFDENWRRLSQDYLAVQMREQCEAAARPENPVRSCYDSWYLRSGERISEAEKDVVARAIHGYAGTLALAVENHCSEPTLELLERAYGHLAVGLQWGDDIMDWRDDLTTGNSNLLLFQAFDAGFADEVRPVVAVPEAVAESLALFIVEKGILSRALDSIRSHFEKALAIQSGLGAACLTSMLERQLANLERFEEQAVGRLVTAGLASWVGSAS